MLSRTPVMGPSHFKIEDLHNLYAQNKIAFNTEYQRSYIWKRPRKQLLMDSILRGYDINKIFLKEVKGDAYECLDGQQRLKSIFEFLGDGFPLLSTTGLGEKKFSELEQEFQWRIRLYTIDAVVVHQADEETITDIFLRLQEGMPLNSAEKLNAMRGIFRNKVVELSQHEFLQKIGIQNYRFAYRYFCAQIALLELQNTTLPDNGLSIVDVKFRRLKETYNQYKITPPPTWVFNHINRVFNFLSHVLGEEVSRAIRYRGNLVPIVLLASYILRKYSLVGKEDEFKEFVAQFITKVANVTYQPSEEDRPYLDYYYARSYSTDSKSSIKTGFEKILGKFLEFISDLPLKDPQRSFDYGQKLAIYFRDKCKCYDCKKAITFDGAEFHHKKPWNEAGPTTVDNGLLLCHECHAKRGY